VASLDAFRLGANYPNLFGRSTEIRYELPEKATVRLAVYNVMGRRVRSIRSRSQPAGYHKARLETGRLPAGVYFVRMRAGEFAGTRRLVVAR